jgi:hypothetical protein
VRQLDEDISQIVVVFVTHRSPSPIGHWQPAVAIILFQLFLPCLGRSFKFKQLLDPSRVFGFASLPISAEHTADGKQLQGDNANTHVLALCWIPEAPGNGGVIGCRVHRRIVGNPWRWIARGGCAIQVAGHDQRCQPPDQLMEPPTVEGLGQGDLAVVTVPKRRPVGAGAVGLLGCLFELLAGHDLFLPMR